MRLITFVFCALLTTAAVAQTPDGSPSTEISLPARPASVSTIAVGSIVEIELVNGLSSRTSKIGERFALRLAAPIQTNGVTIVPAGALGEGEVIDAGPGGFGGKPGKLVIAARYVTIDGARMDIRGLKMGVAGKDYSGERLAVAMIPYGGAIASLFVNGGNVDIPAGAKGSAKVSADFILTPLAASDAPNPVVQIQDVVEGQK